jgi:hypothetical protein
MPNPPPVVTLAVPVLGWYSVQQGNLQVSQFLSVPTANFLSSPDGVNDGLVGVADGAVVHLAGLLDTLDGGQNDFMWVADSLAVPDGQLVFSPFVDLGRPGRWIAQIAPKQAVSRVIEVGTVIQLSPATELCSVRKAQPSLTTILLPTMAAANLGQETTVADTNGVSSLFPITVTNTDGALIGPSSLLSNVDVINNNGMTRTYTPDGVGWIIS